MKHWRGLYCAFASAVSLVVLFVITFDSRFVAFALLADEHGDAATALLLQIFTPTMAGTDDNPYSAPQTEPKRPLGKVPARNTGAIVGAVIGALLVPVWSLVDIVLTENPIGAPDAINLVFVSAVNAVAGAGLGALAQSFRSQ